jgi:plasmid stabilization system protein ParE
MPMGVTKKQERQYEHIKESYEERGVSADEAKERAARTVNKQKSQSKSKKKKDS